VEVLLRHAYRMRETMMIHAKPIFMHLTRRDRNVSQPPEEEVADETPFARKELEAMLQDGLESTEVVEVPFEPVRFSDQLVPAAPLDLRDVEIGNFGGSPMGTNRYYTWTEEPGRIKLRVSGGHIVHYRKFSSNVQVSLYAGSEEDEPVALDESTPPDGETYAVELRSPHAGLHRIVVWPPSNRAITDTARQGDPFAIYAGLDGEWNRMTGRWTLYFYVPRGTEVVGGFSGGHPRGSVRDGEGEVVFDFRNMDRAGYFRIPVPEGQDGRLWKFDGCAGRRALMTVPPWLARSGRELLLPLEVVEADGPR
jgi:hypothetical protein